MQLDLMRKTVGMNVANARKLAGYVSQRELAKHLSFSHTKLSKIERGLVTASHADLEEISQKLVIPVESLLALNDNDHNVILEVEENLKKNRDLVKALELARNFAVASRYTHHRIYSLNLLGKVLYKLGKYRKAFSSWQGMYTELQHKRDDLDKFKALHNLAFCQFHMREFREALRYSQLSLAVDGLDQKWTMQAYQLQASIFVELGDHDRSLAKQLKILAYYEQNNLATLIVICLNSIADTYYRLGLLAESEAYYTRALDLAMLLRMSDSICKATIGLVEIYELIGSAESKQKSLAVLQECIVATKDSRTPFYNAKIRFLYGSLLDGIGKEKELTDALEIALNIDDLQIAIDISIELAAYYETNGDTIKAFQYYKSAALAKKQKHWGGRI